MIQLVSEYEWGVYIYIYITNQEDNIYIYMAILMGYPQLQRNHALQKEVLIIQEKDTTVQQTMRSQAPCVSLVLSKQCEANPHAPSKTTHSVIV